MKPNTEEENKNKNQFKKGFKTKQIEIKIMRM
jgi:hypothetical protein